MSKKAIQYREQTNASDTGVPRNIDDYAAYINDNYNFVKASVGIDHHGRKYLDLKWK